MENSNNNGNAKLIGAVLVGAAVGAVIGILFAPDKGSETRKKLMTRGRELKDKAEEMLESGAESISETGGISGSSTGKYEKSKNH